MRQRRAPLTPDLTPLIDVVFLLLVFFMAISSLEKYRSSIDLELPKTEDEQEVSDKKACHLEVNSEELTLDQQTLTLEELPQKLATFPKETTIAVFIDKACPYDRVAQVLSILQKSERCKIALQVSVEEGF